MTPLMVSEVSCALDRIAPRDLAAEWDNVGLIVSPVEQLCRRALVTVDLTAAVLDEAVAQHIDLIVAYHPPIFRATKLLRALRWETSDLAAEALANNISIYSPHTAWDAAPGGTNDAIVALCGGKSPRPICSAAAPQSKFVVFVPPARVDVVADAMFAAGAGRIGQYSHCSFRLPGQGTFFGGAAANPRVGQRGRLERVDEVRLEAVAPNDRMAAVVSAVRDAHPYEEPAFDVYPLTTPPAPHYGQGRIAALPKSIKLRQLATLLKRRVRSANISMVGGARASITRVFVCVGAAGSLPFQADDTACVRGDCVITGEIRHHDALRYQCQGACAIALGHWASERPGVAELARRLKKELPRLDVRLSRADRDPFLPA